MSSTSAPVSTSVDESVKIQRSQSVLVAPKITNSPNSLVSNVAETTSTLSVAFTNQTSSNTVYAYVTGLAINNDNAVALLEANGSTVYYPSSPSSTGTALAANCAIPLGAPGSTTTVTIPQLAGGRIWFSMNSTLTFLLNPGPGLVEPSVTNPSDPNIDIYWDFCEFTYNSNEIYINISYVDFVGLPIALTTTSTSGTTQHVSGMASNGLDTICSGLKAQTASDGAQWSDLIVTNSSGAKLRALSPNSYISTNSSAFSSYWDSYVSAVYAHYTSTPLTINTQTSQWGDVSGTVSSSNLLTFPNIGTFAAPSSADIFSNSTGPFAVSPTNTDEMGDITARLAAAFNRSTLLIDSNQPNGEDPSQYYKNPVTNHYARIVHAANVDGRGYAFPYDDVTPNGGSDQSGFIEEGAPKLLTVTVGGGNVYDRNLYEKKLQRVKERTRRFTEESNRDFWRRQAAIRSKLVVRETPRDYFSPVDVNGANGSGVSAVQEDVDLERGVVEKEQMLVQNASSEAQKVPEFGQNVVDSRASMPLRNIAPDHLVKPFVAFFNANAVSPASTGMRVFMSRLFVILVMLLLYVLVESHGNFGDATPAGITHAVGGDMRI